MYLSKSKYSFTIVWKCIHSRYLPYQFFYMESTSCIACNTHVQEKTKKKMWNKCPWDNNPSQQKTTQYQTENSLQRWTKTPFLGSCEKRTLTITSKDEMSINIIHVDLSQIKTPNTCMWMFWQKNQSLV